ncbi:uncharacterized protein [Glycine max]|nr:uncharacterized protein LOC100817273 isoform X2 [Glycine max]
MKQKEEELRKGELEADADRMMREYRAQLDAERARKLSQGRNHSNSKSKHVKGMSGKVAKTWFVLLALFLIPASNETAYSNLQIRGTKFQRSTAAERESIQEDLLHLAPLRHPQTLPVAMKKKEGQEDPSPGPRDQRRKRSPSQEARMLEALVKTRVQFAFQDSLGTSRVNSA